MNLIHRRICKSDNWARAMHSERLPWALADVVLGEDVLEIGPGFGVTTDYLGNRVERLTALEVDASSVEYLRERLDPAVRLVHGDGADMPLRDADYSGVVCFTMLHHVPSPAEQDRLFAEACRVLAPGGVFAGMDSLPSLRFRLIHLGDTMVTVDPEALPDRLRAAGFEDVEIDRGAASFRFRARKPDRHNGGRANL